MLVGMDRTLITIASICMSAKKFRCVITWNQQSQALSRAVRLDELYALDNIPVDGCLSTDLVVWPCAPEADQSLIIIHFSHASGRSASVVLFRLTLITCFITLIGSIFPNAMLLPNDSVLMCWTNQHYAIQRCCDSSRSLSESPRGIQHTSLELPV